MFFKKIITAILFSLLMLPIGAHAQNHETPSEDSFVKIRLLPEYGTIKAGQDIWIGIEQSIADEWHTYWKNPGDSGSAPRVKWTLPDGFEVGALQFPMPEKIPYPPLLNYGYSNHTILLQKLTAPQTLPAGEITLEADVEILVCKDECIPEYSAHKITLNGVNAAAENNAPYIDIARKNLPNKTNQSVFFSEKNDNFIIKMPLKEGEKFTQSELASMEYFPADWGMVENTAAPFAEITNNTLTISQKRAERNLSTIKSTRGLITYIEENGERKALDVLAKNGLNNKITPAGNEQNQSQNTTFLHALLFALLGGLVLNLMPCVFPVLSIKALSLVKISEKHPALARKHGLAYTAGVILSFLAIAGILIALKAGGAGIGWGFQLQNPIIISLLAYVVFLVGLNLSGYFKFNAQFGQFGQKLTQGHGLTGSFFTGILATLVATPCTAPFMALAIGYALVQPAAAALSIFAALGLGLALPYLALSFAPALQKRLPKPGAWMKTFQQFLAFPMFATAIWLLWVLGQQAGTIGVIGIISGMAALVFGFWLLKVTPQQGLSRILLKILTVIIFLIPLGLLPAGTVENATTDTIKKELGETYSPEKLEALLSGDAPIFVEMTAAWCITCKVNHAVAINKTSTKKLFAEKNVHYVVGDWTNYDPEITKFLNNYGREGVPIYVYYGPRNAVTGERPPYKILPQILTPDTIKKAITTP